MSECGSQISLTRAPWVRGKITSIKTSTAKEIESWAKKGRDGFATESSSRHMGHLMDNITEQRMLTAKLRDLSKKRHKFIYQNAYDQKMFLEKQTKKSVVLKEMLEGVNKDGSRTCFSAQALRRRASQTGQERVNFRTALLERLDPENKQGVRVPKKEHRETSEASSTGGTPVSLSRPEVPMNNKRRKSVSFGPVDYKVYQIVKSSKEIPRSRGSRWTEATILPNKPIKQKTQLTLHCSGTDRPRTSDCPEEILKNKPQLPAASRTTISPISTPIHSCSLKHQTSATKFPMSQRHARSQSAPGRTIPIQDPRYKGLRNLLSNNHKPADKDISELVKTIGSLSVRPKGQGRSRLRLLELIQQHVIDI